MLLQVKGLVKIVAKFRAQDILRSFVLCTNAFEGCKILCTKTIF